MYVDVLCRCFLYWNREIRYRVYRGIRYRVLYRTGAPLLCTFLWILLPRLHVLVPSLFSFSSFLRAVCFLDRLRLRCSALLIVLWLLEYSSSYPWLRLSVAILSCPLLFTSLPTRASNGRWAWPNSPFSHTHQYKMAAQASCADGLATNHLYYDDTYLFSCNGTVLAQYGTEHNGETMTVLVLNQTVMHPQGGTQNYSIYII